MSTVYFGEQICQAFKSNGEKCDKKAYFIRNDNMAILCGIHSKSINRSKLPKNPMADIIRNQQLVKHFETCNEVAAKNKSEGKLGTVKCGKMKMFGTPELVFGFTNIFPNYKHGGRTDGIGSPSLSPKSIGPIEHGQPGLPKALNLENFHQGNKVFPDEVNENGEPLLEFYKVQKKMYNDPEPHRHKQSSGGKNVPLFSVWRDKDGIEHKIDYFTSRQFYCNYYERSVCKNPDFAKLKRLIKRGYNLMILGYDGYDVNLPIEEHYLDISRPFGHELVLYTMLTHDESSYPWRKWKTFDF